MNRSQAPAVKIVIVNWNGIQDTLECLASIQRLDYPSYEVAVVDNGSTDNSAELIAKDYPHAILLLAGANLGYAGGNNVGIRWALERRADYILLLNNDTVVSADLLTCLVRASASLPDGSILGPKIFFYGQPDTLWFAGGRWLPELNTFTHIGYRQRDGAAFSRRTEVDYITGCALFASAATFREIGLLDERFFLFYEETDWCYRARARGRKCFFVPEARIWHKVSSSFGGESSPLATYFSVRNKLLWAAKHLPRAVRLDLHLESFATMRRILLPPFQLGHGAPSAAKRWLWSFATWVRRLKRSVGDPANKAVLIALRDYYLRRLGNCPANVRGLGKAPR